MGGGSVLVVGSVNADLVVAVERLPQPGETVTGGRFARHGGGKGANQAVAAARAGATVRFVGAVGQDDLGEAALRELEDEGVDVTAVARLAGEPTGVALIAVDAEGRNQITVASGANARVDAELVGAAFAAEAGPGVAVCLLGFEIPDEAVVAAARAATAVGARVVLNPAPARDLLDELAALGVILTPNALEATALSGARDPGEAARALARRTGAPVVVTVGEEGAILADGDALHRVAAPRVDAVDTTGAGDAFNGVLAAGLAGGLDLEAAARRAVLAASASVRTPGARGGMPGAGELAALAGERAPG
jgi:ribokinase